MKKYLPYIIIAALAVALIFSLRGCARRELREHVILQSAAAGPDSGRIWRDAYDKEHRRAEAATGDRTAIALAYGSLVDSIARINDVRERQIDQIVLLQTQLRASRTLAVLNSRQPDGSTVVRFGYNDDWIKLEGAGFIVYDSLSDLQLDYLLRDSLTITTLRQPAGFLGLRKDTYIDVTNANPEVHILGLRSIQVRSRPKPWGLGIQAGVTYTGTSWAPYAGLGLSYNLIRF